MSSWIDIVKKTPNNVSDKKVITVTNVNTPLINNGPDNSLIDNDEKIKKTTKSLTRDKIQQIIAYRTANKLKQDTFAGLLSVPFPDIKNA
jgi:DNA-binding transcriptional regulator YiaG